MAMDGRKPVTFGMSAPRPGSPILAGREGCHFTVCPGPMPEALRGGKTLRQILVFFGLHGLFSVNQTKICYLLPSGWNIGTGSLLPSYLLFEWI